MTTTTERRRLATDTNTSERGNSFIVMEITDPGLCGRCGGPASSDENGTRILVYRDNIMGSPKDAGLLCPNC